MFNPGHPINQTFNNLRSFSGMGAVILLLLIVLGCSSLTQSNSKQLDPVIFQKWLHSYEEDTKELKFYRPSSYEFPRGRGRTGMKFDENGGFILFDIAPNDANVQIAGKWQKIADGNLAISFPSGEKEDYTIAIKEINTEIFKIKK